LGDENTLFIIVKNSNDAMMRIELTNLTIVPLRLFSRNSDPNIECNAMVI